MTFDQLIDFLSNKMRMSQIYQPVLIRALVDSGGTATLRQLAQSFLAHDESQLIYYEKRIKEMPVKVLSKHGVVARDGELIKLNTSRLSLEQKAKIRSLCEQKLHDYVSQRGLGIWDHRLLEADPVSDSVRYQVLKDSGGRCELCGCNRDDRPLDVDHIIPRSRGGSNDLSNLQVLCSKCNRSKGNKDDTDFRNQQNTNDPKNCIFCSEEIKERIVTDNGSVYAVHDKYPVTPGHTLIIPYRHTKDYFSLTTQERSHSEELLRYFKNSFLQEDHTVTGFNVGMNCGESAGQTVMHAHIHLMPRREGDVTDPRGGVRGCLPDKQKY